jgi:hypothetical protein
VLVSGRAADGPRAGERVVLDKPVFDEDGDVLWPSDHYAVLSEVDVFGTDGQRSSESSFSRAANSSRSFAYSDGVNGRNVVSPRTRK